MKTIHKFPLKPTGQQTVKMPNNAIIRHVGEQDGNLFLWAQVVDRNEPEDRLIEVYGTGHEVNEYDLDFIGTVQMANGLVFHVFENK